MYIHIVYVSMYPNTELVCIVCKCTLYILHIAAKLTTQIVTLDSVFILFAVGKQCHFQLPLLCKNIVKLPLHRIYIFRIPSKYTLDEHHIFLPITVVHSFIIN